MFYFIMYISDDYYHFDNNSYYDFTKLLPRYPMPASTYDHDLLMVTTAKKRKRNDASNDLENGGILFVSSAPFRARDISDQILTQIFL